LEARQFEKNSLIDEFVDPESTQYRLSVFSSRWNFVLKVIEAAAWYTIIDCEPTLLTSWEGNLFQADLLAAILNAGVKSDALVTI
jgi:hypothetical protein